MSNIHQSWYSVGGVTLEIMEGKHDADLEHIANACKTRLKMRFRPKQKVRLVNTGRVEFEGLVGKVVKPNTKTVAVEVEGQGVLNVPPRMLEAVS